MLKNLYFFFILFFPFYCYTNVPDTISIAGYNLLNYPGTTGNIRDPHFKKIIDSMQPDILMVEEVNNNTNAVRFLNNVMLPSNTDYALGTVINNVVSPSEAENAVYYKASKFIFVSNTPIYTTLRDINEFKFIHKSSGIPFSVFGVHLKAGSAATDIAQRKKETDSLRKVTNLKPFGSNFVVVGDFNIYNNTEIDYVNLLQDNIVDDGEFYDPITITGTWNNPIYARYHTQCTRVFAESDGGSTSGLDDRFDLLLYSDAVKTPGDMDYILGSEIPYGNDGNHFNDSIDAGVNTAVSADVAYALHHASDHLPILAKFRFFNQLLPLELTALNASCHSNQVTIYWTTTSETNTSHFEIQTSDLNNPWKSISNVPAQGYSTAISNYTFTFDNTFDEHLYIRLKMVDTDGNYSYSPYISSHCQPSIAPIRVYPNPFTEQLFIEPSVNKDAILLMDILGKTYSYQDEMIPNLPKGIYFLQINNQGKIETIKVVKQ